MERLSSATDGSFGRFLITLIFLALPAAAQVRGVPASVTSYDFGGQHNHTPGLPASVTSLGPNGFRGGTPGFGRPPCCAQQVPNPPHRGGGGGQRHRGGGYFPGYPTVYAYPVYVDPSYYTAPTEIQPPAAADQFPEEEYRGGPTIFDRRGPGPSRSDETANLTPPEPAHPAQPAAPSQPAADQPNTLLVFKDGHQLEVQNYAIVGDTLVDLTEGHRRKVSLTDLDVEATSKQNDDRGIDFRLPPKSQAD